MYSSTFKSKRDKQQKYQVERRKGQNLSYHQVSIVSGTRLGTP